MSGGVMKDGSSAGRIVWLDAARGIGILLIVAGHIIPMTQPFSHFIYSFHVPLFFFLSGMVLQKRHMGSAVAGQMGITGASADVKRRRGFLRFVRKKAESLLYPYAVFSFLSLVCDRLFDSLDRFGKEIPGTVFLLGNGPLWFLPALFVAEILFYVVHSFDLHKDVDRWKCDRSATDFDSWNRYLHVAVDVGLLAVSIWFSGRFYFSVADPDVLGLWSIGNVVNRGIIGFLWMESGWLLSTIQETDGVQPRTGTALAVLAFAGSIVISRQNTYVDLHYSLLGNPVLYYLGGFLAVYAVTELTRRLPEAVLSGLAFWGRNSLIVFATHVNLWVLVEVEGSLQRFDGVLQWAMTFVLVLLVEAVLVLLINRFVPWMVSFAALRIALRKKRMRFYIPLAGGASFLLAQYAKYLYMQASASGEQSLTFIKCLTQSISIPANVCLLLAIVMPVLAGRRLAYGTKDERTGADHSGADAASGTSLKQKQPPLPERCADWLSGSNGRCGAAFRLLIGNAVWFVAIYKTVELFWSGYGCILTGTVIVLLLTGVQNRRQYTDSE